MEAKEAQFEAQRVEFLRKLALRDEEVSALKVELREKHQELLRTEEKVKEKDKKLFEEDSIMIKVGWCWNTAHPQRRARLPSFFSPLGSSRFRTLSHNPPPQPPAGHGVP